MGSMNAALEIEIKAAGDDLAEATEATSKLNSTLRDVSAAKSRGEALRIDSKMKSSAPQKNA